MILSVLAGLLALCAVILVLWAMGEALSVSLPGDALHVIPLRGKASLAEQRVRSCLRCLRGRIVFVDTGLETEAQLCVQLLLEKREGVFLCGADQLTDYLEWETTLGARAD
jgi:hypothetical protein